MLSEVPMVLLATALLASFTGFLVLAIWAPTLDDDFEVQERSRYKSFG